MKYILDQEEYNELINGVEIEKEKNIEVIRRLCMDVANYKPFKYCGSSEERLWPCCKNNDNNKMGYCDECQVRDICPEPNKQWSK